MLSLQELGALGLPGCGLDSACQRLSAGSFGAVPGLGWPTAFLGASWFLALAAAWLVAGQGWPAPLRWLARGGALVSLVLLAVMIRAGELCPYCLGAHAGSLGFLPLSERARRAGAARSPLALFALVFAGTTLALHFPWTSRRRSAEEHSADELASSTRAILEAREDRPFTGRYRLGPEDAAVRLVVFSDYQCPDCRRVEGELQALLAARDDLSLSAKHYPLCRDCNRRARALEQNPHPNACWAARAAEAAGLLDGAEGFWRLHRWLFGRGGGFTDAELVVALPELGFEPARFEHVMQGSETLARVQADVEEALALGIHRTPMIFVNGVELRGWESPGALARTVEAVARSRSSGAPGSDRPPGALEKAVQDWRLEPELAMPLAGRALGSESPPDQVVLWGEYLDANTRELDALVRAALRAHPRARYSLRSFPVDPACNPGLPNTFPGSCLAAQAAEAAWVLGGAPALERMQAWLLAQPDAPGRQELEQAAEAQGLERAAFARELSSERVLGIVRHDIESLKRLGVGAVPLLFVAGKRVPRWRFEGQPIVATILEEALGE
jgi:predicted DsbA family dithiol-disulfide isomerase